MIIHVRKKALAIGMVLVMCLPINAMQRSTARVLSTVVATGCAGLSYTLSNEMDNAIHPLAFVSASTVLTYMTYSYLHRFTPEGRLNRAIGLLHTVNHCKLIRESFFDERLFFDALHEIYLTEDLPFVSAYHQLIDVEPICREAISLLGKALLQASNNCVLEEKCNSALLDANRLLSNIVQAAKRIKEHKEYLPQLHIYRESLVAEKQTFAQQQMADAHGQIAQSKASSNTLKWLKFILGYK